MATAIGIRVYRIGVREKGNDKLVRRDAKELSVGVNIFIDQFIQEHSSIVQNSELERSWYLEKRKDDGPGNCQGHVHYGTFGFESNFIDTKTKKRNYRRKTTDVEEIPLYFEFWCPENERFGFVAFQSFQGRSCINLVMAEMKKSFETENPGFLFDFKKLLPNDTSGGIYRSAPVKRFRLIKRGAPSDLADKYFGSSSPDSINFEITMSARRNKSLGSFSSLSKSLKGRSDSVVTYDGIEFEEAIAEIRVGNRTRRVGVLGLSTDAGVIDITNDIDRGLDGHPTFKSLQRETDEILKSFYKTMKGARS